MLNKLLNIAINKKNTIYNSYKQKKYYLQLY